MINSKTIVAAALTFAVSAAASAQVQQVYSGNALDANNQIGSGGANRPVPGFTPVNGNDIVTGNVAGLKSFKGNLPYSSQYEFRGNLGSSSLNNFYRTTAPQAGAYGLQSGINQVYYSPQRLTAGAMGAVTAAPIGSGVDNRYVPLTSLSPTVTNVSASLNNPAALANSVPARAFDRLATTPSSFDLPGAPGRALASPLFGMRPVGEDMRIDGAARPTPVDDAPPKLRTDVGANETVTGQVQQRVNERVNNQIPETETGIAALVGQTNKDEFKISDTYRNLLAELQTAGGPTAGGATGTTDKPDAGTAGKTTDTPGTGSGTMTDPLKGTAGSLPKLERDPVTGQLREARPTRQITQNDPMKPGYTPGALSGSAALEELPAEKLQVGQKVDPLPTLVGKEPTSFNELMKQAEGQIKVEKYIDAARTYQQALRIEPDNALALVGRAHASLCAGLYESAVSDLKLLFTKKPEMIAVRYKLESFLPAQREEFLLRDLAGLSQRKTGNSASFLIAYIHYHAGRTAASKAELDRQALREWRDGWEKVLRKAWFKE